MPYNSNSPNRFVLVIVVLVACAQHIFVAIVSAVQYSDKRRHADTLGMQGSDGVGNVGRSHKCTTHQQCSKKTELLKFSKAEN
jgi:hypothetical protein